MKIRVLAVTITLAMMVTTLSSATIMAIRLSEGYDDITRIDVPIYDNSGLPSVQVTLTATYDRKAKFVRRMGGRLPATRGPEYDLDPKVDLATLLTEALGKEALAMGLSGDANGPAWRVTGVLKDVYLESRQIYMGATLFYGYLDVELDVSGPSGEKQRTHLRLHNYSGGYNAGIGRRDEAESAAAHMLVEGAQEILVRLNRQIFKAPAHREMGARLESLVASGVEDNLRDLRMVGLSGLPAAVLPLLTMVPLEEEESVRSALIDSLANLGSPDAVTLLAARYEDEDEDCRWYTLKAMDYIGGPDATQVVNTAGMKDEDAGPKRLAGRIAAKPAR